MTDLISVIIPTFNRSAVLLRAIESVLNQTYNNFELIIVDDGSTDETELLLSPYIKSGQLHYYKKTNGGVASARNYGVKQSSGAWIAFLDSDDEWLPEKLSEQIKYLSQHPELSIAYTEEIWIRNSIRVNQKKSHQKIGGRIFENCLEQCLIAPSSVIMTRTLFNSFNGFDENFVVCEDYDLWLKISCFHEIGLIDKALIIKYGGHEDQLSTKFFAMDMWRIKSMLHLFKTFQLQEKDKNLLCETMKTKGAVLIKGYLKHNNPEAARLVEQILSEIN
jgi:glycosyltransferase involved in cell wall biosynthesis